MMIPYGRQSIDATDVAAVVEVLKSDWLTQGPMTPRFEEAVAARTGAAFGVAVNSATSALHIACAALDVGPGDWVWTSPITFVASANCARYCGANVDFVDIDPRTYNMSVAALGEKLRQARRSGRTPKVLIPVHFAGQSCDMVGMRALADEYGFKIIEDASHAVGGDYRGAPIGNCANSDVTVFSFHPVKIITSAEGGMAMTNDEALARRMRRLRSHGVTRAPEEMQEPDAGAWRYEQIDLGFNYRMTDVQAALGLSQLRRIDEFVAHRRRLAAVYDERLADLPLLSPYQDAAGRSAFHLYVIQVDERRSGVARRALFDRLRAAGIGVNVHYIPVHLQPYYRQLGFESGQFPHAEEYYSRALSLPLFFDLSPSALERVVAAVRAGLTR